MFVSFEKGLLFLANMKCASSSVSQSIRAYCEITPQSEKTITHRPMSSALDYLEARDYKTEGLTSFVTIRNPWARVYSFYKHVKAEPSKHPFWRDAARFETFEDFLLDSGVQEHLAELNFDHFCVDKKRGKRVDFCFRQETLLKDLKPFLADRGIEIPGLPQARTNGRESDVSAYYDHKTSAIVGDIFASDVMAGMYEPPR